jgi:hypothetical protein
MANSYAFAVGGSGAPTSIILIDRLLEKLATRDDSKANSVLAVMRAYLMVDLVPTPNLGNLPLQ